MRSLKLEVAGLESKVLQYESESPRIAHEWCRRTAFYCWIVTAPMGPVCLLGYWWTRRLDWAFLGYFALLIGGAVTGVPVGVRGQLVSVAW